MRVVVVAVGRARGALASAVAEYERRARRYFRLEVVEVAAGASGQKEPEAVRRAEFGRLAARLPEGCDLVALTRTGRALSSRDLACYLEERALHARDVAFALGGAWGLAEGLLARADLALSLSPMTLPHELARLVLAEQLYRAGTILKHEPYHKGP